jgi:predicted RecA/RadA family phage recombinase
MAQTPCVYRSIGDVMDYTPTNATLAGTVVLLGTTVVTIVPVDIPAAKKGATALRGIFNVPKDNSDVSDGDALYWDADGSPVGGTALSGAFTKTASTNVFAGIAIEDAGTTTGDVDMVLRSIDGTVPGAYGPMSVATVAVGGTAQANANAIDVGFTLVTGADDTAAIVLPAAAAGKVCVVANAVSNKILKVFPAAADTVNNAAANAVYNQAAGAFRMYVAYNAVDWRTDPETIA